MFTLNDLLDQVDCQGEVKVNLIDECGDTKEVFTGFDLRQVPYIYGAKGLAYIYSEDDVTVYEVYE